jgi:Zn finger protein HypA/HybF involved in hydrogenase expression
LPFICEECGRKFHYHRMKRFCNRCATVRLRKQQKLNARRYRALRADASRNR